MADDVWPCHGCWHLRTIGYAPWCDAEDNGEFDPTLIDQCDKRKDVADDE